MSPSQLRSRLAHLALLVYILSLFASPVAPQPIATASGPSATAPGTTLHLPLLSSTATAQQLIARAYGSGAIDYGTSLLYRAYALFGDPRLPLAFHGSGSEGEDRGLFVAIEEATLPSAILAQLRPFTVRPDHPDSLFNTAALPGSASKLAQADLFCDTGNWTAITSQTLPVKVHAMCADFNYEAAIRSTLALVEELWAPMTALMGEPIRDAGGANGGYSDDIDIYLVEPGWNITRGGAQYEIRGSSIAQAIDTAPFSNGRSSGFIMVGRTDLGKPGFKSTLAHELFHVLQSAHNRDIQFRGGTEWWFTEASAVWAESHFVRATTAEEVHVRFTSSFQRDDLPLHISADPDDPAQDREQRHMYAAYIWPFFMEQELGPQAVADVWKATAGIGEDWDLAMAAMDDQLSFADNFRRFALRNLNMPLTPGDPIQPRYNALDPSFPDGAAPSIQEHIYLLAGSGEGAQYTIEDELPALRAHYFRIIPDEGAGSITVELAGGDPEALDLDLLVKLRGGGWEQRAAGSSGAMGVCNVEEAYLIVSNHTLEIGSPEPASIEVAAEPGCGERFSGSVQYVETGRTFDGGEQRSVTLNVNVKMRYDPAEEGYVDDGSTYSLNGTSKIVIRGYEGKIVQESDLVYSGSGNFDGAEHIQLDYLTGSPEVYFDLSVYADVTSTTTLYADGTSYTYTSTEQDQYWTYGCGDANGGVLATGEENGTSFTIDCTNTLNNDRQEYSLKVTGSLHMAQ